MCVCHSHTCISVNGPSFPSATCANIENPVFCIAMAFIDSETMNSLVSVKNENRKKCTCRYVKGHRLDVKGQSNGNFSVRLICDARGKLCSLPEAVSIGRFPVSRHHTSTSYSACLFVHVRFLLGQSFRFFILPSHSSRSHSDKPLGFTVNCFHRAVFTYTLQLTVIQYTISE